MTIEGSIKADKVVNNPEIIQGFKQRSIIVSGKTDEIGLAINHFLDANWRVIQCWARGGKNHYALLMSE